MRFSKKAYPLLSDFDFNLADDLDAPKMPNEKAAIQYLAGFFDEIKVRSCFKKVSFVSKRFADDAIDNQEKIMPSHEETVSLEMIGKKYCFIHNKQIHVGSIGEYYLWFAGKTLNGAAFNDQSNKSLKVIKRRSHNNIEKAVAEIVSFPLVVYRFRELADIKAKHLPPKKKIKDFHCRYKSEFDFPIELLTENWYAESIQSHPFVVRGHWRMQAHGEGMKKRKLIWIDKHMKQGVKRGAFKKK